MDDIFTRIIEVAKSDELPTIASLSRRLRNEVRKRRGSHFYSDRVMLLDAIKRNDVKYISANYRYKFDKDRQDTESDMQQDPFFHVYRSSAERVKAWSMLYFASPAIKDQYLLRRALVHDELQVMGSIISGLDEVDFTKVNKLEAWTFEMGYYASNNTAIGLIERISPMNTRISRDSRDELDFLKGIIASGRACMIRIHMLPPGFLYEAGYKKFNRDITPWIARKQTKGINYQIQRNCGRDVILDMLRFDPGVLIKLSSMDFILLFKMTNDKLARSLLRSQIRRLAHILDLSGLIPYLRSEGMSQFL